MGYPGRQNIYESTIRRMVQQALEEQEEVFRKEHEEDTDDQLIAYLRSCALRLRHTPWPGEILGGSYIEERFGSWDRTLILAKLSDPRTLNQQKSFIRFQEEVKRQKKVYRRRKAEKKILAQKRLAQQAAKKKEKTE
ncbi:MAG: hypothetical protein J6A88_07800 [Oscillospiraceae bacterium]|nr:hypothetical protein [Oscillospiraceae bacterium]